MYIEIGFFLIAILPYWYATFLPHKTQVYWLTIAWCCCWFIAYYLHHGATAAVVNNAVELIIALVGTYRRSKWKLDVM